MKSVLWAISTISLVAGVLMFLGPRLVVRLNDVLTRHLATLDQPMMRFRYLVGLLLMVSGYLFFRLAL